MNNHWFVVDVEDSTIGTVLSGSKLQFVVSPRFIAKEDGRKLDEILNSAHAKNYEIVFCSRYSGVAPWQLKNIDKAVISALEKKLNTKVPDRFLTIEPTARLREPSLVKAKRASEG